MILLSFDIEEFDFPLEKGLEIELENQIDISRWGAISILTLLKKYDIKATFYSTVIFAEHNRDIISQIVLEGHEIASHGYYHSQFKEEHYRSSKEILEEISGEKIYGFRAARMASSNKSELIKCGYKYDSSLNPTLIPGRYNNLSSPRSLHLYNELHILPASVSPLIRFPLFWLSFHLLPNTIYNWLIKGAHKKDGYVNIYFHPWEFSNELQCAKYGVPKYISRCSGDKLLCKLEQFICFCKRNGFQFSTTYSYIKSLK